MSNAEFLAVCEVFSDLIQGEVYSDLLQGEVYSDLFQGGVSGSVRGVF